ncbi:hypothetical protein SGRA_1089 [Saprospira grandis str. Lewin]|uniref:Uncharacterized protein n=1 Tax=Saprospira grandis (strain Lewin) TaxID=984262 RepID=H6L3H7_SAPGL|nr:hypothetical protein SGRA_1089 [Saprospira grandis str. Lewin]
MGKGLGSKEQPEKNGPGLGMCRGGRRPDRSAQR